MSGQKLYSVGYATERIQREFERALSKFPKDDQRKIVAAIENLSLNPRPFGKKFKPLHGEFVLFQRLAQYRLRVGNYRVFYDVDDDRRQVVLIAVRRRTEKTYR